MAQWADAHYDTNRKLRLRRCAAAARRRGYLPRWWSWGDGNMCTAICSIIRRLDGVPQLDESLWLAAMHGGLQHTRHT